MSSAITRRVEKLAELAESLGRRQVLAVVLARAPVPAWAEPVPDGRCVYLIGGDATQRAAVLDALRQGAALPAGVIVHDYTGKPGASRLIAEMNGGAGTANADEVAGWGARGDRKTSAALDGWLILADRHRAAGGALPFRVMVPTGSHTEHKLKLVRTLAAPHWGAVWALTDDDHLATATVDGVTLLALDLFGTSDPDALNRLRMEAHGLWAEEAAPAAYEGGGGVTAEAWSIALTSMRMPTARKVAALTSNFPDDDFWGWQRFEVHPERATVSVRIPPGESASPEDRERWRVALASRPDLLARLVDGEPATVPQGPQVAVGYRADVHVAKAPIPVERSLELWLAWDSAPNAHTHCCVIGQRNGRKRNVLACLVGELVPFEPHFLLSVVAWLQRRAPWTVAPGGNEWLYHIFDPNMDPREVVDPALWRWGQIRKALGGHGQPGPVDWPGRSGPMLTLLGDTDGAGGPALQIDPGPDTLMLRKALGGRWHYAVTRGGTVVRDLPFKPDHPWEDAGDAFCYLASIFAPEGYRSRMQRATGPKPPNKARAGFNVFDYTSGGRRP